MVFMNKHKKQYSLLLVTKTNCEPTGKIIDIDPLPLGTKSKHIQFTISLCKETGIVSIFAERTSELIEIHKTEISVLRAALRDLDQWAEKW